MPNQLKPASQMFLEVEDIKSMPKTGAPPKTQAQIEREQYEAMLEKDKLEINVTEE